jgi:hypothetical protein
MLNKTIILDPKLFGENPEDTETYGELGMPGIFRHLKFEVVAEHNDKTHGKIVECKVINAEVINAKAEGHLMLLVSEVVEA